MQAGSSIQQLLLALAQALKTSGVEHALIGGLALAPRGFPRGTKDVDFLIHENAIETVRAIMRARGAEPIFEGDEFSSYIDGGVRADFQHARREISQGMLARSQPVAFGDASIPVLQAEDLIGLKVQASYSIRAAFRTSSTLNGYSAPIEVHSTLIGCEPTSDSSIVKKTSTEPLDWLREKIDEALAAGESHVAEPPPPSYPISPEAGVADLFDILATIEAFGVPEPSREPIDCSQPLL